MRKMEERTPKRLACRSCQRRKIKCDRGVPCQMCLKNGEQCIPVHSQRVARGKNGGRRKADEVLGARLEKLEGLLSTLQAQGHLLEGPDGITALNTSSNSPTARSNSAPAGELATRSQYQYLGGAFWSSLRDKLNEIQGEYNMRNASNTPPMDDLDSDSEDEEMEESPPSRIDITTGTFVSSVLLQAPPPVLKRDLCAIFFTNVDPVFKILHAPSMRAHMEKGALYLHHDEDSVAVAALTFVIYYAAVNTMSDEQCGAIIGQPKAQALRQYRTMAEAALTQAEYIVSPDLATLQAFVIYLAMLRHEDRSRRCWTLVSLAVRIAHALGLHSNKPTHDIFASEQRRRLWHQICVLDLQLSIDLASDPLIIPGTHSTPAPMNVNDADLVFGSHNAITSRVGWTDMTFSLASQLIAGRALRAHMTHADEWQKRQGIILTLDQELQTQYLAHCDPSIPFQAFTMAVSKSNVKACLLHAVCPTLASNASNHSAPPINSEYVLSLAVEVLTSSQDCTGSRLTEGWHWTLWVQWHALAVAFAGLAFITTGVLADRAWNVAEAALNNFTNATAKSQQAQLLRPLEKLALKARRSRASNNAMPPLSSTTSLETVALAPSQRQYPSPPLHDQLDQTMSMEGMEMLGVDLSVPPWDQPQASPLDAFSAGDGLDELWRDFLESFPDHQVNAPG